MAQCPVGFFALLYCKIDISEDREIKYLNANVVCVYVVMKPMYILHTFHSTDLPLDKLLYLF